VNYAPDLWHDFAVTVGGLAGALTGLLFVALSIKGEALAGLVGGVINARLFLLRVPGGAGEPGGALVAAGKLRGRR
jgi:hypothetical protein